MSFTPTYLSMHQPRRPGEDPASGEVLKFRTFPRLRESRLYNTSKPSNMICQIMLYRWCRSDEYATGVAISELYGWLITRNGLPASKNHLGRTVTNALDYDANVLKGTDKSLGITKPISIYRFRNQLELQYGLEYMICAWLRKFLADNAAPEDVPSGPQEMEEELDMIAGSDDMELREIYLDPILEMNLRTGGYPEVDWRKEVARVGAQERSRTEKISLSWGEPPKSLGGPRR